MASIKLPCATCNRPSDSTGPVAVATLAVKTPAAVLARNVMGSLPDSVVLRNVSVAVDCPARCASNKVRRICDGTV